MRSVRHLVIFLRAPQRGAVKRRLARDIGERAALGFYQNMSGPLSRLWRAPKTMEAMGEAIGKPCWR